MRTPFFHAGAAIRAVRLFAVITVDELAAEAKMPPESMRALEDEAYIGHDEREAVAEALGMDVAEFDAVAMSRTFIEETTGAHVFGGEFGHFLFACERTTHVEVTRAIAGRFNRRGQR
jgi:hypothetical protein